MSTTWTLIPWNELTQTVSIYDKHVDDYSTADNELINNKGKIYIGI